MGVERVRKNIDLTADRRQDRGRRHFASLKKTPEKVQIAKPRLLPSLSSQKRCCWLLTVVSREPSQVPFEVAGLVNELEDDEPRGRAPENDVVSALPVVLQIADRIRLVAKKCIAGPTMRRFAGCECAASLNQPISIGFCPLMAEAFDCPCEYCGELRAGARG